jgi:hypothetical protein
MNALELQCLAILQTAATSEVGIVVRTNDAARARLILYKVRKDVGDVELSSIAIRVSPDDSEHELWLLRNASHLLDIKALDE